ncbi:MAG: FAD-dependent monooxygenase [Ruminococcus sp.]|nr:FAD-dependent monooxygenase [Ruminococcus sp.]
MIRVGNIKVPLDFDFTQLERFCADRLGIPESRLRSVKLSKKSVDARRKSDVHFNISLDISAKGEAALLKRLKNAVPVEKYVYEIPQVIVGSRPVIVGFGPAGMFAALVLASAGARPIVLERGYDVDSRVRAVEEFRSTGRLDTECNIQFGEGGAGTFSDGKLTTGIKDRRIRYVLEKLVEFGAPEEILYMAKPHIGTDKLRGTVRELREHVISLGGEVRFGARFCGYENENGHISAAIYTDSDGEHTIATDSIILATGHSARDVFELLYERGVDLSQKNFAVGVRIEHLREDIDKAMYGDFAGHPALKAADYKLVVHLPNGRTLYTFCMCPGGEVVAASSEEGRLAVNGMSCFARDAVNSNSALLVNVGSEDYGSDHPLAGMHFQRRLEERAYNAGGGGYSAPVCTVGELTDKQLCDGFGRVAPSYTPAVKKALPDEYLPSFICESLRRGIAEMGRKIDGFDDRDAILTGIESRSSSPVRINRGDDLQSLSVGGLYPCGEGAGYAGGIVSAAVDGIKCAEAVIEKMNGGKI